MTQETNEHTPTVGSELQVITNKYLQQKQTCSVLYQTLQELLPELSRYELNQNPELIAANALRRSLRADMNTQAQMIVPRGVPFVRPQI
ncbi:hypothetical protein KDA06_01070 [Candidatus Saccharibacteria bacterium]|nr:hypothetical protein [Candidatus Saccharibacteria bacterium]